ncbi:MAG: DUF3795 domain-containing protein [Candidatus Zixiibacteriota bacterium]
MDKMLGRCGYRCDLCAARSDDPAIRQKLIDGWRKYLGHQMYTVENVRCDGCMNDGRLADKDCPVRPCAISKGVENCAHCDEYPCDKLEGLICSREKFVNRLGEIPEEDYNLCLRQFESEPELASIRKALGKE